MAFASASSRSFANEEAPLPQRSKSTSSSFGVAASSLISIGVAVLPSLLLLASDPPELRLGLRVSFFLFLMFFVFLRLETVSKIPANLPRWRLGLPGQLG